MKKVFLFGFIFFLSVFTQASVLKTVDVLTAGTLSTLLTTNEKNTVTNLTLTGSINQIDFATMNAMPALSDVDLTNVSIVAYSSYPVNTIPTGAFSYKSILNSIVLPNSITSIGISAFSGCSGLTSIDIPASVTIINSGAFSYCFNLFSVNLSTSSLSVINANVFIGNTKLDSINIPEGVTEISTSAFEGCSNLRKVILPNTLTTISTTAFKDCNKIDTITIPKSVKTISNTAFENCSSYIIIEEPNSYFSSEEGVLFDDAKTTLIHCPTSKVGNYNIPSTVNTIGDYAFKSSVNLSSISIPNSVTKIGFGAFINCGLDSVLIPSSVTFIGNVLFQDSQNIKKATINGPNYIDFGMFRNCSNLETVKFNAAITSINTGAFSGCISLDSIDLPATLTSIGEYAFAYSNLKSLTVPSKVTSIDDKAFSNCTNLTTVNFNATNCNYIGYPADNYAPFNSCTSLNMINIGSNVTKISAYMFSNCKAITSITIPTSVVFIGDEAFSGDTGLTSIYANASTPINLNLVYNVFFSVNKTVCILHVPSGSKNAYKTATQWMDFTNIVEDITTPIQNTVQTFAVSIQNGELAISEIPINETITIFNLQGSTIYNQQSNSDKINFTLPAHGVYIVRVGTKCEKVVY